MIYLKSALVGLLAVAAAAIALPILAIIGMVLYGAIHSSAAEGSVGWDPIGLVHPSLPFVAFVVVCFASGFLWKLRRLTPR